MSSEIFSGRPSGLTPDDNVVDDSNLTDTAEVSAGGQVETGEAVETAVATAEETAEGQAEEAEELTEQERLLKQADQRIKEAAAAPEGPERDRLMQEAIELREAAAALEVEERDVVEPEEEEDEGGDDDYERPQVIQQAIEETPQLKPIIPVTETGQPSPQLTKKDFEMKKKAVEDEVKTGSQLTQETLAQAKDELKSIIKTMAKEDLGKSDEQSNFTCIDYLQILLKDNLEGMDKASQPLYLYDRWNLFSIGMRKEISSLMVKMLTKELGVEGQEETQEETQGEDLEEKGVVIELGNYKIAFDPETGNAASAETSKSLKSRLKMGLIRPRITINRRSEIAEVREKIKQISNIGAQERDADSDENSLPKAA